MSEIVKIMKFKVFFQWVELRKSLFKYVNGVWNSSYIFQCQKMNIHIYACKLWKKCLFFICIRKSYKGRLVGVAGIYLALKRLKLSHIWYLICYWLEVVFWSVYLRGFKMPCKFDWLINIWICILSSSTFKQSFSFDI